MIQNTGCFHCHFKVHPKKQLGIFLWGHHNTICSETANFSIILTFPLNPHHSKEKCKINKLILYLTNDNVAIIAYCHSFRAFQHMCIDFVYFHSLIDKPMSIMTQISHRLLISFLYKYRGHFKQIVMDKFLLVITCIFHFHSRLRLLGMCSYWHRKRGMGSSIEFFERRFTSS